MNTKLIECVSCFDPRDSLVTFNTQKLIEFAKMYPLEFDECGDLSFLTLSLNNFIVDVRNDDDFANLKGVSQLAQKMVEKKKDIAYPKVYLLVNYRLQRLASKKCFLQ